MQCRSQLIDLHAKRVNVSLLHVPETPDHRSALHHGEHRGQVVRCQMVQRVVDDGLVFIDQVTFLPALGCPAEYVKWGSPEDFSSREHLQKRLEPGAKLHLLRQSGRRMPSCEQGGAR